jgi:hypothetical protein
MDFNISLIYKSSDRRTKMKIATKICFAVLASLLVVPLVACGGGGAPPPPPPSAPTGNQPPVIASLTAETPVLIPTTVTKITCNASDPDGDVLAYTWSATGGTISGTLNNIAVWKAPDFVGEFTVSVTVDDGKGGTVAKSCTLSVQANRRPVVSSVTAEPAKLQRGETSTVTCLASDPDDDTLTYAWSATGGTITGTGNIVTWKAPSVVGEFVVSVSVKDDKGGITESSCRIVVQIPEVTAIRTPLSNESGSVYYDGTLTPTFKIGDNANNVGVRAYFSFDVSDLAGAEIKAAKLSFTVKETVGNPWFAPPFLYAEQVEYGPRSLQPADFHLDSVLEIAKLQSTTPGELDVYLGVSKVIRPPEKPRFQVRLRLATNHNGNNQDDYIEFSKAELTITYVK